MKLHVIKFLTNSFTIGHGVKKIIKAFRVGVNELKMLFPTF